MRSTRHEVQIPNIRISGTTLGEGQIPCLLLDHYRSDTAGVDWRSLEYSDLSPLARKGGKSLQCVTSLAALDLLERKRKADASMLYKVA